MKKLNDIPGKSPFKVPENYFEEVNRKILTDTSDKIQVIKNGGLLIRFRPYLAIAASIAGFIIITYTAVNLLTAKKQILNISEIVSEGSPELYINDIDLYSLEENAALSSTSEMESGISNEEIIDYLISENIDINDIFEQL
ncbi:MAG: hypothetical protein IPJ16_04625 [Bacteroidales bacterium]|nr:hypothetical protein [Bacteroidales bacterium]